MPKTIIDNDILYPCNYCAGRSYEKNVELRKERRVRNGEVLGEVPVHDIARPNVNPIPQMLSRIQKKKGY
jgi:hypothetical protein